MLAQFPSDNGWVEVNVIRGCWPLTVELTHTGARNSTLFYDFEGDPSNPTSLAGFTGSFEAGETVTFTYSTPQPDSYLIRVVDQTGSPGDRFDFREVQVLERFNPSVEVRPCAGNEVRIFFTPETGQDDEYVFDSYLIDWGDGSQATFVPPNNNTGIVDHTYGNEGNYEILITGVLDDGDATYCSVRRLQISTIQILPTPSIQSVIVTSDNSILFNYEALNPNIVYNLQIDRGSGFEDYLAIDPLNNPNNIETTDQSLTTNRVSYEFRIRASDFCESLEAFSQEVPTIALDYQLVGLNTEFEIQFSWQIIPDDFARSDLFNDLVLVDQFNEANANQLITFSNCTEIGTFFMESVINGVISQSENILPFENQQLTLPTPLPPNVDLNGSTITLTFEPTNFPLGEIQISRLNTANSLEIIGRESDHSTSFIDTSIPTGLSEACYSIRYTDQCGNLSENSTEICIPLSGKLRLPNAFSPNGDNINDVFIAGEGLFDNFQMLIYNRWGDVVFQSNESSIGWDGLISGKQAPQGTYLYKVSFANADNLKIVRTGTFVLIR